MKKRFGEILLEQRIIDADQLADALALQRRRGMRLGAALVARGHLTEQQLITALGGALNIRVVDLRSVLVADEAVHLVSHRFADEHELFPFALKKERTRRVLTVAMSDPLNYRVIDELSFITDATIEPVLARASDIDQAINRYYGTRADPAIFGRSTDDGDGPEMTIVRKGGQEEVIDTTTGKVLSPFIRQRDGTLAETPEPGDRAPRPRAPSALLLTEEVAPGTPVDPVVTTPAPPPAGRPAPSSGRSAAAQPGVPVAPAVVRASMAETPGFDDALGALIDRAGGAVTADSVQRLERKFWALMRVLARKGVVTSEDFLRELGEEDR